MGDTYTVLNARNGIVDVNNVANWWDDTTKSAATHVPGQADTVVFSNRSTAISGTLDVGTIEITAHAVLALNDPTASARATNINIDPGGSLQLNASSVQADHVTVARATADNSMMGSLVLNGGYLMAMSATVNGNLTFGPNAPDAPANGGAPSYGSAITTLDIGAGGTLDLGTHNILTGSLNNANEGTGNAYNPRAGITGTGQFVQYAGERPQPSLTPSLNFGTVHVGDTVQRTLTLTNLRGDQGGYPMKGWLQTNGLTNPDLSATPTQFAIGGRGGNVSMPVTLNAQHAGSLAGQTVEAATQFGLSAPVVAVPITGEVLNYAKPAFTLDAAPAGTQTWEAKPGVGVIWAGVVQQGQHADPITVGIQNAAAGPADPLTGLTWGWQDGTFTDSGSTAAFGLDAGQHQATETVSVDTSVAGWHYDTIVLQSMGGTPGVDMATLPTITDTIFFFVQPAHV